MCPGWTSKSVAGTTGLEPATSAVTGQRSNQLNYVPRVVARTAGWWAVTDLNRGPSRCKSVTASSYHNRSEPITAYQIFHFWGAFRRCVSGPDRLLEVLICYTFRYTHLGYDFSFCSGTISEEENVEAGPVDLRDDERVLRASNLYDLGVNIPASLQVLCETLASCTERLENWHTALLLKIVTSIDRVCRDLLKTTEQEALTAAAWNARNLLELWVWTKYCCASRESARRFNEDCLRDCEGLTNSYFKICDLRGLDHELESAMREKIANAAHTLGLDSIDASFLNVREAAKAVGLDGWFTPCNAFLSKFAHPTAFLVIGAMQHQDRLDELQVCLTAQGVFYGHKCVEALEQLIFGESSK